MLDGRRQRRSPQNESRILQGIQFGTSWIFYFPPKNGLILDFSYISFRNPQNNMISWLNHILNVNFQPYFDVRDSFRRNLSPKISADVLKMTCFDDFRRRFTRVFSLLAPKICNFRWFCVPNVSLDILYVF